jgi:hypothetical protein
MLMGTLTRRLQVLLDEDRFARLEREAEATGRPVAELVREAIDDRYGIDHTARREAYAHVLAAEPMPVDDWATMKAELLDAYDADPPR